MGREIGYKWYMKERDFRPTSRCRKWYNIGSYFLWNANKNWYAIYRMMLFPMILSDPWRRFQGYDIIQRQVLLLYM